MNEQEDAAVDAPIRPSSAGQATIPLTAGTQPDRRLMLIWLSLPLVVAVAAALLFWRYPQLDAAGMAIMMTIGGALLFFAFWRNLYGLVIPGLILVCLSFGITLTPILPDEVVLWSLSAAFVLIGLAGRTLYGEMHNWPFVVAAIIAAVALAIWLTTIAEQWTIVLFIVPLVLITLGLFLGFRRRS